MVNPSEHNPQVIDEFRANHGKVGGMLAGTLLLLLTTTGARSGRRHTTPMMYIPDGERMLVIASNLGAPRHPDWYHNLVAHPAVTIEAGDEAFEGVAEVTAGEERLRLWTRAVALYPFLADHQAKTARQIPVVALKRREG